MTLLQRDAPSALTLPTIRVLDKPFDHTGERATRLAHVGNLAMLRGRTRTSLAGRAQSDDLLDATTAYTRVFRERDDALAVWHLRRAAALDQPRAPHVGVRW